MSNQEDSGVSVSHEPEAVGKNSYRNKLKKRKRKFIANVKGFGKRGNFGRGTHLETDEWSYYINIMDAIKAGFESIEDKREYYIYLYDLISAAAGLILVLLCYSFRIYGRERAGTDHR